MILVQKSVAHPWMCDVLGHMTTRHYVAMFDDAAYHMLYSVFGWTGSSDDENRRQFDVFMETAKGDILYFSWIVQKVATGQFKDCWMTVSVSAPRPAGQSG